MTNRHASRSGRRADYERSHDPALTRSDDLRPRARRSWRARSTNSGNGRQARIERGAGRLVSIDSGMSQADGSFVLGGLTAGTYYVCALPQNGGSSVADREQQERPVFSCFPNVPDVSSAAPIQVGPGDRFRGAEIRLLRGRLYTLEGHLQLPPGAPANPEIQVMLTGPAGSEAPSSTGGGVNKGKFEFPGLRPGAYFLRADSMALEITDPATGAKTTEYLGGKLEVTVADGERSEIVLALAPGMAIQESFGSKGLRRARRSRTGSSYRRLGLRPACTSVSPGLHAPISRNRLLRC